MARAFYTNIYPLTTLSSPLSTPPLSSLALKSFSNGLVSFTAVCWDVTQRLRDIPKETSNGSVQCVFTLR